MQDNNHCLLAYFVNFLRSVSCLISVMFKGQSVFLSIGVKQKTMHMCACVYVQDVFEESHSQKHFHKSLSFSKGNHCLGVGGNSKYVNNDLKCKRKLYV